MKLLIEPEIGADPLIKEIDGAKKTIEIAIFRFDHEGIKGALERAVDRGVAVHALIANTNHGEEKGLRKLEMDFLPAGIEVSRTADDLLRHHYKFMIVDRRVLYVLTFNYTHLDIEHSRSFALVIDDPEAVEEASRLFYADVRRQSYKPELKSFVVSPLNAREQLSHFMLKAAGGKAVAHLRSRSERPCDDPAAARPGAGRCRDSNHRASGQAIQ